MHITCAHRNAHPSHRQRTSSCAIATVRPPSASSAVISSEPLQQNHQPPCRRRSSMTHGRLSSRPLPTTIAAAATLIRPPLRPDYCPIVSHRPATNRDWAGSPDSHAPDSSRCSCHRRRRVRRRHCAVPPICSQS